MATVTRTLKTGGDTGKLNRAEVRAVTAAIAEGRTADVLSGAVLKQFRAARKRKPGTDHSVFGENAFVQTVTKTAGRDHKAGTAFATGRNKGESIPKTIRRRDDGKIVTASVASDRAAPEKAKASSRSKN
jgi:hypothetical protein